MPVQQFASERVCAATSARGLNDRFKLHELPAVPGVEGQAYYMRSSAWKKLPFAQSVVYLTSKGSC